MENFTPVSALLGGAMIGAAAVVLMLFNGRIAGISGIVGGMLGARPGDLAWRALFVVGLIGGAFLAGPVLNVGGPPRIDTGYALLAAAGVIVGFGTRLGSGCTSGHGVCGIARLSPRSLAATAVFMAAGAATVFVARHVLGS